MKIVSLNVNGTKAFYNRGEGDGYLLDNLIKEHNPDIILLQETKCSKEDFIWWLSEFSDYNFVCVPNKYKKGYAGVGALIKKSLHILYNEHICINNSEYDSGRILELFTGKYYIIGVYVMNSGSDKEDLRFEWDLKFHEYLSALKYRHPVIVLGDFNSTRDDKDCYAFEQYFDQYPGCYKFEIDALNDLINSGFKDTFRELHGDEIKYSWFSYRGGARYNNQGWRLDYALVDDRIFDKVNSCEILGKPCEYSDHSPILLDINLK